MTSRLCAAVNVQLARAAMNRFGSPIVSNSSWGTSIVDTFFQAMLGRATHVHGLDKYTFWGLWDASKRDKAKAWRSFQTIFRNMRRLQMDTAGFQFIPMFLWRCALLCPNVFSDSYSHPEKTCFQLFFLAVRTKLELDKAPWPEDNRICFLAAISASEILPALIDADDCWCFPACQMSAFLRTANHGNLPQFQCRDSRVARSWGSQRSPLLKR